MLFISKWVCVLTGVWYDWNSRCGASLSLPSLPLRWKNTEQLCIKRVYSATPPLINNMITRLILLQKEAVEVPSKMRTRHQTPTWASCFNNTNRLLVFSGQISGFMCFLKYGISKSRLYWWVLPAFSIHGNWAIMSWQRHHLCTTAFVCTFS